VRCDREREGVGGGDQADVGPAAPGDEESLTCGGALHVPAEEPSKAVSTDVLGLGAAVGGVELAGLEPATSCMPCRRYFQLSYSPFEFVLGRPVY
jgi:hypothetical protein